MLFNWRPTTQRVFFLALLLSAGFANRNELSAQSGTEIDLAKLEKLLSSKKVHEIRFAVQMLEVYPVETVELFPLVSRRANHPELSGLFERMVSWCSSQALEQQLRRLTESRYDRSRKLIQLELDRRVSSAPSMVPVEVPKSIPRKPAPTKPPAPKPLTPKPIVTKPSALPSAPTTSVASRSTRAVPRRAQPAVKASPEVLKRLHQLDQIEPPNLLRDEDWEFLIGVFDDYYMIDVPAFKLSMQICKKHFSSNESGIRERLMGPRTKNPHKVVRLFYRAPYKERATYECLWALATSDDSRARAEAMNAFNWTKEMTVAFADRALEYLKHAPSDKPTQAGVSVMVFHIARAGTPEIRRKFFQYHLDRCDSAFQEFESLQRKSSGFPRIYTSARNLLQAMSSDEQSRWVAEIARRGSRSKFASKYVLMLSVLKCDLSESESFLRSQLKLADDRVDALSAARILYRVVGPSSGVYPLFKEVLMEQGASDRDINSALRGVQEVGPPAAELVPRIVQLIETNQKNGDDFSFETAALKAIGPGAGAAGPALIRLLSIPDDNSYFHSRILQTLSEIKPDADVVLPMLVEIAVDKHGKYANQFTTRTTALKAIQKYGTEASEFASVIQPLADSKNETIARVAVDTLRIIRG